MHLFRIGSMAGSESSRLPSWNDHAHGFACAAGQRRSISFHSSYPPYRERQKQLAENVVANLPDWRDKRSAWEAFHIQSSNSFRPFIVNAQLITSGALVHSGYEGFSSLDDTLQSLCEQGRPDRALDVLLLMDHQGTVPSGYMYRSLLKACSRRKALLEAKRVHAHLAYHGLELSKYLGEELVSTLVKCGGLDDALQVFDRLPKRSVFCWTALISGYTNAGQGQEALRMYKSMQNEDVEPNTYTFVSLLKSCGSMADLEQGKRIHVEAVKYGCAADIFVSTCLVDMYGKCGSITDAQAVFDALPEWNVVLCTAMLAAYVGYGEAEKALQLYEQMWSRCLSPNDRTFVSVLQACGMLAEREAGGVLIDGCFAKVAALNLGKVLHAAACRKGHDSDVFVGSTLISLYGKCESIADAERVFDGLPQCNVVAWTTMLVIYIEQDQAEKALQLYEQLQDEGVSANNRTFIGALQACGRVAEKEEEVMVNGCFAKVRSLGKGKAIHADICRKGYGCDVFVGSSLVSMYAKCGSIMDAEEVLSGLSEHENVAWTAMLAAYVQHGQAEKVLQLYELMCEEGTTRNDRTFVSVLQACGMLAETEEDTLVDGGSLKINSFQRGRSIHADARKRGYDSDVFVANTLVSMYGKCRSTVDAQNVFNGMSQPDVVAWTAMLTAYVEHGLADWALQLYAQMKEEGVSANARTFVCILQACGMVAEKEAAIEDGPCDKVKSLEMGRAIHADARQKNCDSDVFVGNTLISMYGNCGSIMDAQTAFDGMLKRDVVSWNALLVAYVEHSKAEKALQLYEEMLEVATSPDAWTFVSMLQGYAMLAEQEEQVISNGQFTELLEKGKALHAYIWRKGYDSDVFVCSSLLSMYSTCGSIADAQIVFDGLTHLHVVSWNAMAMAYLKDSQPEKALQLYRHIRHESVSPDIQIFVNTLQACGMAAEKEIGTVVDGQAIKVKSLELGKAIHAEVQVRGFHSDLFVCSTLVSMYGKCGSVADAWNTFVGLPKGYVVLWNAMLTVYVDHGHAETALALYSQMHQKGVSPDAVTYACIVKACSKTGSLDVLRQVHCTMGSSRNADMSPLVANTLVSAYGSCGSTVDAQRAFDAMGHRDVVSWNALIAAYARQGDCSASMKCYEEMQLSGMAPDGVTFLSLISACSHAGLVDQGVGYFESMRRDYGITPEMEHYVSMVDLFGRAGCFPKAEEILSAMPVQPILEIWLCLMAACRQHGNVELAEKAFGSAVRLQPQHPAAYVLMSNIYADAGISDCAKRVQNLRQKGGARKQPGQSWIEYEQELHTFSVGDFKYRLASTVQPLMINSTSW